MGADGIVRRIDDLGRVVIPMEYRRSLGLKVRDPMSITVEGERIVLRRHVESCVVCGTENEVTVVRDRGLCADCIKEIKRL